jgi:hypothetical protein
MSFSRKTAYVLRVSVVAVLITSACAQPAPRWDATPSTFQPVQRRGFREGLAGARRDIAGHHRPDVNNRPEYKHPAVPTAQQADYRDAYSRGYNLGVQHALGGGDVR